MTARTGWALDLCQDECRGLSKWFASRIDARQVVRMVCAEIKEKRMPTCLSCIHFTLRDHHKDGDDKSRKAAQDLAKSNGFGRCAKGAAWHFMSPEFERTCRKYQPADQATTDKRKAWLAER